MTVKVSQLLLVFKIAYVENTSGHSEGLHSGLQTENLASLYPTQGKVPGLVTESVLGNSSVDVHLTDNKRRRSLEQSLVVVRRLCQR